MNVNAVQQWTGDALLILGDHAHGTGAGFLVVAVIPARAGVHGTHQLEIGRKGEGAMRPADGDDLVLQRLAHDLQHPRAELGQFIQEQDPAVCQGDLTRSWPIAPTHQPGMTGGVMR